METALFRTRAVAALASLLSVQRGHRQLQEQGYHWARKTSAVYAAIDVDGLAEWIRRDAYHADWEPSTADDCIHEPTSCCSSPEKNRDRVIFLLVFAARENCRRCC